MKSAIELCSAVDDVFSKSGSALPAMVRVVELDSEEHGLPYGSSGLLSLTLVLPRLRVVLLNQSSDSYELELSRFWSGYAEWIVGQVMNTELDDERRVLELLSMWFSVEGSDAWSNEMFTGSSEFHDGILIASRVGLLDVSFEQKVNLLHLSGARLQEYSHEMLEELGRLPRGLLRGWFDSGQRGARLEHVDSVEILGTWLTV